MIRDFEIHEGKLAPAYASAAASVATGMGVILNRASKTFGLPSAATADEIFVVHKARKATGANTALTDFSDYFPEFNAVASGEFAPLKKYEAADVFGTDQFASTITSSDFGKYLVVGTDGKWDVGASSAASVYRLLGFYTDAGAHTLARIEVLDTAGKNPA